MLILHFILSIYEYDVDFVDMVELLASCSRCCVGIRCDAVPKMCEIEKSRLFKPEHLPAAQ